MKLFEKESPRRLKPLLYTFRVLLSGIHLMNTGQVEANLGILSEEYALPYLNDLITAKTTGSENITLDTADLPFHEAEYNRLREALTRASEASHLPEKPSAAMALNDLLVRLRLKQY